MGNTATSFDKAVTKFDGINRREEFIAATQPAEELAHDIQVEATSRRRGKFRKALGVLAVTGMLAAVGSGLKAQDQKDKIDAASTAALSASVDRNKLQHDNHVTFVSPDTSPAALTTGPTGGEGVTLTPAIETAAPAAPAPVTVGG